MNVVVLNQEDAYGMGLVVAGWDEGTAFYTEDGALELMASLHHEGRVAVLYEIREVGHISLAGQPVGLTTQQARRLEHFLAELEIFEEED